MALNFKEDIKIDPEALDVEWLRQAELGGKYARNATRLRKLANLAEQKVKVIKAELIKRCNEDPKRITGKDKPNAADIEAYYRTHSKHKEAKEEWIEAVYEADMAELAQKEISYGRKAALEALVSLFTAQYFAGPVTPRNLSKEWIDSKRRERVDDSIQEKVFLPKRKSV